MICAEPVRVNANDDRALVATERRRSGNAREGGEHGSDAEEREVLDLPHTARLAGKDQLAHGNAAGVKADHKRGNGPGRHKGTGPLDIRDGLRQGLAHVRSRMKVELDQTDILDGFRFHMLNARNVEKVVLIIGDEISLHLRRIHSAIGLRYINHRKIEVGENIHRHTEECQHRTQRHTDNGDENRDRTSEGSVDEPHTTYSSERGHSRRVAEMGLDHLGSVLPRAEHAIRLIGRAHHRPQPERVAVARRQHQ